mmetsp:Transcript_32004/g.86764  ORF Transcript_32004/g.86764 Transcript_32004/m.86764 type:complete len:269 (+) Transcript_32004:581-1387(+)
MGKVLLPQHRAVGKRDPPQHAPHALEAIAPLRVRALEDVVVRAERDAGIAERRGGVLHVQRVPQLLAGVEGQGVHAAALVVEDDPVAARELRREVPEGGVGVELPEQVSPDGVQAQDLGGALHVVVHRDHKHAVEGRRIARVTVVAVRQLLRPEDPAILLIQGESVGLLVDAEHRAAVEAGGVVDRPVDLLVLPEDRPIGVQLADAVAGREVHVAMGVDRGPSANDDLVLPRGVLPLPCERCRQVPRDGAAGGAERMHVRPAHGRPRV